MAKSFEDELRDERYERWEDPEEAYAREQDAERQAYEAKVLKTPELDYYDRYPAKEPKREIGEYVASQGFKVPLIGGGDAWQWAMQKGEAMIRSELPQDYSGYSGFLRSVVLDQHEQERIRMGLLEGGSGLDDSSTFMRQAVGGVVLAGLMNGELAPADYLKNFTYIRPYGPFSALREAAEFGVPIWTGYDHDIGASLWRYIPGANIRLFRDPQVDGRYWIGADTGSDSGTHFDLPTVGETIRPRKCDWDLPVRQLVEFYEAIRTLPRFDQRQCPLVEMQLDNGGELYFLQYYKTNQLLSPSEPFELPRGDNVYSIEYVRGATPPEGQDYKLYFEPRKYTRKMDGQGYYMALGAAAEIKQEILVTKADLVVQYAYQSLKGNHWVSSPVYKPKVTLMQFHQKDWQAAAKQLDGIAHALRRGAEQGDQLNYINVHVTSNGHQATMETDWKVHSEPA